MPRIRSWTDEDLRRAVNSSTSVRAVLQKLNLVPAGGNYRHVNQRIKILGLDISHFTGKGWNTNWVFDPRIKALKLSDILVKNRLTQSHKLRLRLIKEALKKPECELCGWAALSVDGRQPLELDHINGDHSDNRIENLRILCPNCHSLQLTHRGKNRKIQLK